ncbi:hypothetical protein predicted by Glimmer/Critica [Bdellovibrio bacteriovorus HD100]|uniref:Uncharacterized protein n=1 Tax=Bdellovibrio bacteriovorus (strain ATCC 15356 / DSM 50701 / NCIMB 9529 / HD100) TaxID=264462 RepID=Q6MKG8_BDEBA|nr:hypothetical protein predicted by Glimmer/Critica [Bdellovibrio bacteriovorus HD100]
MDKDRIISFFIYELLFYSASLNRGSVSISS